MRSATAADIPQMRVLETAAPAAAHWGTEMYTRIFDPSGLSRLALVLEEGDKLWGFLVALCAGPEWELENIVVGEELRRRGWATRLIVELLHRAQAAGAEAVFLEVRESNQPARALYRKTAFVKQGRKRGYYSDPSEDGIRLSRALQPQQAKIRLAGDPVKNPSKPAESA